MRVFICNTDGLNINSTPIKENIDSIENKFYLDILEDGLFMVSIGEDKVGLFSVKDDAEGFLKFISNKQYTKLGINKKP